jgi:hypothetical protein
MQCKEVAQVIQEHGFSPLSEAARNHAASCTVCSSLLSDFEHITAVATELPGEVEPPARIWLSLRAQLEAENIIRQTEVPSSTLASRRSTVPWWQDFGMLLRGRLLAGAALAILIVGAGYIQINRRTPLPLASLNPVGSEPFAVAATSLDQEEQSLGSIQTAQRASLTSSGSPVDNSLRENLATLNTFIKECRKRLQEDPNDQIARDYLASAYQQKAEILAAMMERGRSVN